MSDAALLRLLRLLKERDYRFTAVTPSTHARVLARPCEQPGLRDIFGWNRPFRANDLAPELLRCLEESSAIEPSNGRFRSRLRVATIGADLFFHSAFPTTAADAVFLGPDTYRFIRFVHEQLSRCMPDPTWILDMGAGTGAAAISVAKLFPAARTTALDINPRALELAGVNATAAGVSIDGLHASEIPSGPDLVIANPPYMMDADRRAYRDGGDLFGGQRALDWAQQALRTLPSGGSLLLYTGAAVINGRAPLTDALRDACALACAQLTIEEIDPDVFGEELDHPAYAKVERIAVIGSRIGKP